MMSLRTPMKLVLMRRAEREIMTIFSAYVVLGFTRL